MTPTSRRYNRFIVHSFTFIALLAMVSFAFPQERYAMHSINTTQSPNPRLRSDSLLVRGVYWELPVTAVQAIQLKGNTLTVTGNTISSSGVDTLCEISRTIPGYLQAWYLTFDTASVWRESDELGCEGGDTPRCFVEYGNRRTGERFRYQLPFGNSYPLSHVYLSPSDTVVIALASGHLDRDMRKWMGYLLVSKRH